MDGVVRYMAGGKNRVYKCITFNNLNVKIEEPLAQSFHALCALLVSF